MADVNVQTQFNTSLEDNLKKALTELLVLNLLSQKEYYIGELTSQIKEKSGGALVIVFPYGAIYRMSKSGFIAESEKRNAPDGRLRQYYSITEKGKNYLDQLMEEYHRFISGVSAVLA
jgi:PadR family transcriptional regulator PadR